MHEPLTSCIVHLADSANFEGITSYVLCSGLTGSCFESPNDTIHVTVVVQLKEKPISYCFLIKKLVSSYKKMND